MTKAAPPDVIFVGDSRAAIKKFPKEVRENFGGELQRLQDGERPLDSGPMAPAIPSVFELRDEDRDLWYRVLQGDIELGRKRLRSLKQQLARTKKH